MVEGTVEHYISEKTNHKNRYYQQWTEPWKMQNWANYLAESIGYCLNIPVEWPLCYISWTLVGDKGQLTDIWSHKFCHSHVQVVPAIVIATKRHDNCPEIARKTPQTVFPHWKLLSCFASTCSCCYCLSQ